MQENKIYDLAIVGGGYAGLVAANRACQLGRSVVVFEKGSDEAYPCNSRFAGGVLHISYRNLNDAPAELAAAVHEITDGTADPVLVSAISGNALRVVRWLAEEGAKYGPVGNVGWRQFILSPPRPPSTRMDWEGRGADVALRALERNLAGRGGELVRGARAVRLVMERGRCAGVEVERNGAKLTCRAGAVLLADGGYQANPELVAQHISPAPWRLKQRCALTGTGDGLRMAQEAGAATRGLDAFYGHLLSRDAMHNDDLWPYPMIDELAAAGIVVDPRGRRFADEGLGGIYLANAVARLPDPASAIAVFDETAWQGPGRASTISPNPALVKAGGTLLSADTLAALASKAGVPVQGLERSVTQFNEALAAGRAEALQPKRSTSRYEPMAIRVPPFYAIPLCAGITFTMGGIAIDGEARVLRDDGSVLPGLYAAGSTTGGLDGGNVCGYVGGLVKAMVFGMLAAEHVGAQAAAASPA